MEKQSLTAQRGEIEFRKKLICHQIGDEDIFDDEFGSSEIEEILQYRMGNTFKLISDLLDMNIIISPYLEIGAERCQRAMVLENDFCAQGAALDISYHMLNSAPHYQKVFNKSKLPIRICCDINHLPFKQNSIPFVFCYQTLHHFPDMRPILNKVVRVLAPGGTFFFSEEPIKNRIHCNLYKSKKIHSNSYLKRASFKEALDYIFSQKSSNEIEHGIIENEDISLKEWKVALAKFDRVKISIKSLKYFQSEKFSSKKSVISYLASLFGGEISGICSKQGKLHIDKSVDQVLICPSCLEVDLESSLVLTKNSCKCQHCHKNYTIMNNVLFLLVDKKMQKLYPEFKNI